MTPRVAFGLAATAVVWLALAFTLGPATRAEPAPSSCVATSSRAEP